MLRQVYKISTRFTRKKEKLKQIPSLLQRISVLLEEGYTFSDSIHMLLPYHAENVEFWQKVIQEKMRNGENVVQIFKSFSIPNHYLISIQIADANGELAKTLKMIAYQMDFQEKIRKKLSKLLVYPIILLVFLVSIFVAFRTYFMPNIKQIVDSRSQSEKSNFTFPNIILYFPDLIILSISLVIILFFLIFFIIKKQSIQHQMKILLSIPVVNYFFKLQLTSRFSRLVGSLLLGGFSLQQTLEILKGQQLNGYLRHIAVHIESKIIYGDPLSNAVHYSSFFFPKFEEFIKHGEQSGYLGRELMIYSDLLDERLHSIVKTGLSFIQPLFFVIIALSIIAAYISILLPMYNIIEII